jgi:hypothetical protein
VSKVELGFGGRLYRRWLRGGRGEGGWRGGVMSGAGDALS